MTRLDLGRFSLSIDNRVAKPAFPNDLHVPDVKVNSPYARRVRTRAPFAKPCIRSIPTGGKSLLALNQRVDPSKFKRPPTDVSLFIIPRVPVLFQAASLLLDPNDPQSVVVVVYV